MKQRFARALMPALTVAVLGGLPGCGSDGVDVSKNPPVFSFFTASSFDLCLDNPSVCLEALTTDNVESLLAGVRLVKLEPTSKVFEDVDVRRIRQNDLRTLEGSGFFTALTTLSTARQTATQSGFDVPAVVNLDAYCTMPFSENNAYFRNTYGYESASGKTELEKVICLGLFFDGKKLVSLANDRFVVAHEFFHALLARSFLGSDKSIPEAALTYSHDLDAFNEGAADFFAEQSTATTLSRIFGVLLPWRTAVGRKTQGPGTFANIYRDGSRYTELLSRIQPVTPALPVLACAVKDLGGSLRRAKADAAAKGLYFGFDVYAVDILDALVRCSPGDARSKVAGFVNEVFLSPKIPDRKAKNASLSLVIVPTQKSLCGLQRIYQLSPTDLRKYHSLDACAGAFQASWQQDTPMRMARDEVDEYALERRKFEAIYVIPGVHLDGEAADCRLRGATNIDSPEVALTMEREPGRIGTRFHNVIFQPLLRGSWYRDVALGDFLPGRTEPYDLRGPLRPLTVGETPIRFVSAPTQDGRPTSGMNGFFWLPVSDLAVKSRAEKHTLLAKWVKQTLMPYRIDPKTNATCLEGGPCVDVQNYDLVCRSHARPMSAKEPQPGGFEVIPMTNISVHVFDCEGDERTCKLTSY
jgi:hypothetical protein